jgi:hypothetical protein
MTFTEGAKDGKHYWLTPWQDPRFVALVAEFGPFDFDPCPYPRPEGFDGLTCEWGQRNYVNPPFGSVEYTDENGNVVLGKNGKPKRRGVTAWVRKAIEEYQKGKLVVLVYPIDKWVLMILAVIGADVRNLYDVQWEAIEDRSAHKGTGRHIACFILDPQKRK